MAEFRPLHGILPRPDLAPVCASRPFDNYSLEEARTIAEANPYSFLNVVIQPMLQDPHLSFRQKLLKGKVMFDAFLQKGIYQKQETAGYYIYRHETGGEVLTGIIGLSSIDDVIHNVIKPHEQTLENKEVRLKEYLDVIDINAEPVFLTFDPDEEFYNALEKGTASEATWSVDAEDFGKVSIWAVTDEALVSIIYNYFQKQSVLYIADGHHRTASSVFYGKTNRETHPNYTGDEAFNYFLTIIFPQRSIRLREFNRVVSGLNGLSVNEFMDRTIQYFDVSPADGFPGGDSVAMYFRHQWYILEPRNDKEKLPTQVLTDHLLKPVLGIEDLRNDKRIDFIGGKTSPEQLESLVDSGEFSVAFYVPPVPFDQFRKFADNGWFMPPKSTWFEPKLLNGLVIYSLSDTI